jgi:hypothetical protein
VPLGPAVPDAVSDVWVHFNEAVAVPGNVPKEVKKIYEAGSEGKCMTCGGVAEGADDRPRQRVGHLCYLLLPQVQSGHGRDGLDHAAVRRHQGRS